MHKLAKNISVSIVALILITSGDSVAAFSFGYGSNSEQCTKKLLQESRNDTVSKFTMRFCKQYFKKKAELNEFDEESQFEIEVANLRAERPSDAALGDDLLFAIIASEYDLTADDVRDAIREVVNVRRKELTSARNRARCFLRNFDNINSDSDLATMRLYRTYCADHFKK